MMEPQAPSAAAGLMKVSAVFQFFRAASEGNDLHLSSPDGATRLTTFQFPAAREDGLCLADYVAPLGAASSMTLALFVTTAGEGIRAHAEASREGRLPPLPCAAGARAGDGRGLRRAAPQPDPQPVGLSRRPRDHHARPLPGQLPRQALLVWLSRLPAAGGPAAALRSSCKPEEIGVQLTDGFMMDPEATVERWSSTTRRPPTSRWRTSPPAGPA